MSKYDADEKEASAISSATIVRANPPASVTVRLRVSRAAEGLAVLRNSAIKDEREFRIAPDADVPWLTNLAIHAACESAMFLARHSVGAPVSAEFLAYSWTGSVDNATPFAIATRLAIERALRVPSINSDPDWSLQSE